MPDRKTTATNAGYHFLNMYQSCRWRWYLRHAKHLVPVKTSKYLLFGQAFHWAKEHFYKAHPTILDREEMAKIGLDKLADLRDEYEREEQYVEDREKMHHMIRKWHDAFAATEFQRYEILGIEQECFISLPGDFKMTVRPDVIVRDNETGLVGAFETKTTSRSVSEMARSVACQKQVDVQMLGMMSLGHAYETLSGVIPDITYKRQSICRSERTAPIKRSKKELADSQLNFAGLFGEIGQKLEAIENAESGVVPEMLFDRNGTWCGQFGCEYESICTSRFRGAPPGYRIEE